MFGTWGSGERGMGTELCVDNNHICIDFTMIARVWEPW